MARSGQSRAQANRAIRADALREQLSNGGHAQHVLEITEKLTDLTNELTPIEVTRLKAAADLKMKIVDKYLPSPQTIDTRVETVDKQESNLTDDELRAIAAGSGTTTSDEVGRSGKVH